MPLAVNLKHKKIYNAKRVGQQQCLTLFVAFSFTRLSCVNRNLLGTDKSVNKGNHPKPTVLYVPQYVANFVYKKSCSI